MRNDNKILAFGGCAIVAVVLGVIAFWGLVGWAIIKLVSHFTA